VASNLNSFDQSPLGGFIQSPLGARGVGGGVIGTRVLDWAGTDTVRPHVRWFGGSHDNETNWSGRLADYGLILWPFPLSNPVWWSQFLDGWAGYVLVPVRPLQGYGGYCGEVTDSPERDLYQPSVAFVNTLPSGLTWNSGILEGPFDFTEDAINQYDDVACEGTVKNMRPHSARLARNVLFWDEPGDEIVSLASVSIWCGVGGGGLLVGVYEWLSHPTGAVGEVVYIAANDEPLAAAKIVNGVTWVMANLNPQVSSRILNACLQKLPSP